MTGREGGPRTAIPRGVWALGVVSLLMDSSSELVHSLLPVFLVTVLGASAVALGVIEGVAEAAASITKLFSGTLSDYLRKRKLLTVIGYGLAAATKPLFPLATSVSLVFSARLLDRIGKGIRGAPRDALIADLTPKPVRGAAYGLRQSLDTIGAVAGPALAMLLMVLLADDIRSVFWFAVLPAGAAVFVLVFAVEEPARPVPTGEERDDLDLAELRRLGAPYWALIGVTIVLMLARFSEAFLILRAESVGLGIAYVPLVLVVMNLAYAASAYPAGRLSDSLGRGRLLALGLVLLIAADFALAFAGGIVAALAGVALWGLHMGFTQGLLATMVADRTAAVIRGTAFGIFHIASGIAVLGASVVAGALWDLEGPRLTFLAGAGFTSLALLALILLDWTRKPPRAA